ncbi:uroporphyrinogen-III decarboxylase [Desulfosporosinus orientis DSM 765]|uniref:Uroporphyrinogen-III decarboxylase n=1 Tax=Desulfosporosinus orientis (strain ATCC 19365 / DSM 765 / NCIMB 8382 / VKM B-1628 / Singapore I) TaxID=768706 RepID=G7W6F3_DESOD|nr:uroporphyrinogen decarboxylase family protein [Desulfosporosinus orientis]AET68160.1 uroporphyrinogen-III decarboxylase [Desulfosporosinus orientis DSM 765]
MTDTEKLYQERLNRIMTAVSHQETDSVPVILQAEAWTISQCGLKIADIQDDMQKEFACFGKIFETFYCDGTLFSSMTRDVRATTTLGGSLYFLSSNGITTQHKESIYMNEDEYAQLTKDPLGYTVNEIFPRKYPELNKPYPQNLEALKESLNYFNKLIQRSVAGMQFSKDNYGIPTITGAVGEGPLDLIFDFFRGFRGTLGDLRRRPEELKEAAEAVLPLIMSVITMGQPTLQPFPFIFLPLHVPTFLSPKQFGEFYWPGFRKLLYQIKALGGKALIYLEGNWEHLYEYVNDFPKDFAVCILEKDNIFEAKKKIGDTVTLCGGIDLGMLRAASKQECIDHVKEVVDKCAPGGGFLFSTDKLLLAPGDVNPENLKAVNEFVHSYK